MTLCAHVGAIAFAAGTAVSIRAEATADLRIAKAPAPVAPVASRLPRSIAGPDSISSARLALASAPRRGAILSPEQTTHSTAIRVSSAAVRSGRITRRTCSSSVPKAISIELDYGRRHGFDRQYHPELDVDRDRARRCGVRSPADLRQGRRRLRPRSEGLHRSRQQQHE
jgi:hypothetical protein